MVYRRKFVTKGIRVFLYHKWKMYLRKGKDPEIYSLMKNFKDDLFKSYRKDDMAWLENEWAKISANIGAVIN